MKRSGTGIKATLGRVFGRATGSPGDRPRRAGRGPGIGIWLALPLLLLMLAPTCGLFDNSGGIEFPPVGDLYINYNEDTTMVDAVTLLAEGGGPLNGYTWSLASGSSYPTGTTVDPLTGVFKPTGVAIARTPTTFKMTVTAGSNSATSPAYRVRVANWGSGPMPSAILQQWGPDVDPSALELMDAEAGKPYGASLFVMGGTPPYRWAIDGAYSTDLADAGLSVHAATGVVSGTPFSSASGRTLQFRVIVTDAVGDTAVYQPVYSIGVQ